MFGHLRAEDFINLIEGGNGGRELPVKLRSHLNSCAQCTDAFASAQGFHSEMTKSAVDDQDIPEPDWFQFRADVRNAMLSRAAQRQSKTSYWSGWLLRPALSWGLAVAFVAGLSSGLLIWNRPGTNPAIETADFSTDQVASLDSGDASNYSDDVSLDASAIDSGLSTWSQTSIFEELSQLDDAQAEKLQRFLEADAQQAPIKQ